MKFSEQWLREWVDPPVSSAELSHQLTMAGLEVDALTPVAAAFDGVVVGEVKSLAPHPQADKLQVCEVDVGASSLLTIVCGAKNVETGMKVPTACIGASLPGGLKIKKAKLRDVESHGMLCSARELGLSENAEGLLPLGPDAEPGMDIRRYLQLDDYSIELGLTPNRSDCLSIYGIAREVSVINQCPLKVMEIPEVEPSIKDSIPLDVREAEACPRYVGRVIKGINNRGITPLWMQERLRRCDIRSISPVVDVTNYVMLELGQPMHAFDCNKLDKGIRVRYAAEGESIRTLDGQDLRLDAGTLVIADHQRPVALAGIIGGLDTAVDEDTDTLFLESAFFDPLVISGKARLYNLHTDSSHRFERGVDPALARRAIERATALLLEIVGGDAGPVIERLAEQHLPKRVPVMLRGKQLDRMLGVAVNGEDISKIIINLGMICDKKDDDRWEVVPPSFRFDIHIEADLIEEVARIYGYNRIPNGRPLARLAIHGGSERCVLHQRLRELLVDRGYQEAITYSFVDAQLQSLIDPENTPLALANPISTDLAVMRTSLWPGLIKSALHNQNRQQKRIRLFEYGIRFSGELNNRKEENVISAIAVGSRYPEQWGQDEVALDFYDIKGDVESLLAQTGRGDEFTFAVKGHPALHPGQSAAILSADGGLVGWLGVLHPQISKEIGLEGDALLFELRYDGLREARLPAFRELSKYPAIRRDLAIIVDENISAHAIQQCIAETAGPLLQNLQLFDVYQGKGVDSGRKSIALGLTLQDFSRTLTDGEIDALIARVLSQLNNNFRARLRD